MIKQTLLALNYLHSRNLVHRDVKLENLLVTGKSESGDILIKLTDFGFVTSLKPGEKATLTVGSPKYMSPEIMTRKPYDYKCDVWALGVLTFILLSGDIPF